MALIEIRADLAPVPAIARAIELIERAGLPRNEHVHNALGVLIGAIRQHELAEQHRGLMAGRGPFCGCCGQPKREPVERVPLQYRDCTVKEGDARPAGKPGECFYCHQLMGEQHRQDCVIRRKTVKVRMSVEFDHDTVESWTQGDIEFHLNDSSFCMSNLLRDIEAEVERGKGCLCPIAWCEVIGGEGL